MKAIFLCNNAETLLKVYDEKTLSELSSLTGIEKKIYIKDNVLNKPELFSDTELIFSTWGMPEFSEDEIKKYLPSLRCVFYGAGSVQYFARPFLKCGVKVFSAWAANAVPVAEMTVAEIILANKGFYLTNRLYHEKGNKSAKDAFAKCRGNYGETVGIIGAGMIGRLVYRCLRLIP